MIRMEIIELIFGAITAGGVLFGVITYFRDSRRKTKHDTLDAYSALQENTLSKINQYPPSEIREATEDKQSALYKELSGYLAEIERFCVGINERIYDFDTFYELAHGYFESDRGLLKPRLLPLLEAKLKSAKEDYFFNLHKIWKRMEEQAQK